MKRLLAMTLAIMVLTCCASAMGETKIVIGQEFTEKAKENIELYGYVYSLDPDGFSPEMMEVMFDYALIYLTAEKTYLGEVFLASKLGEKADIRDEGYATLALGAIAVNMLTEEYLKWLKKEISTREFGETVLKMVNYPDFHN